MFWPTGRVGLNLVGRFVENLHVAPRSMDTEARRRGRIRPWLAASVIGLLAASSAGCSSTHPSKAYPLLSDGWKAGDQTAGVLTDGSFEADLTPTGACAWLGPSRRYLVLWPAGYSVRFHPTELLGPTGVVIAKGGQTIELEFSPIWAGVVSPNGAIDTTGIQYRWSGVVTVSPPTPPPPGRTRCGNTGSMSMMVEPSS